MLYSIHHGGHMCHTPCGPSSPGLNSSQFSRTGLAAANWIENLEPRSTWYWTQRQMKSLKAIEVRRGWLSKPLVESSQGKSELGRRQRNGRQRSVGVQQIHSYSYPQILLSLSLTQTDLQLQTSCCHVKFFFVPNAELCPKDEAGGYCSNSKCWVESDDANKHLGLFFLMSTVKSKIYQVTRCETFIERKYKPSMEE